MGFFFHVFLVSRLFYCFFTASPSMFIVEYYLLKRFSQYALYFVVVATIAAFIGQHVVKRLILGGHPSSSSSSPSQSLSLQSHQVSIICEEVVLSINIFICMQ
uniref:Uncharacterized protein n=1 Tax=Nelumbo nucifera TaxID=4432 RepID=A0A822ZB81_NELNU|nr:TPA_asm: hypothetical protein HUJ06_015038 [Nelumbo nucifera]